MTRFVSRILIPTVVCLPLLSLLAQDAAADADFPGLGPAGKLVALEFEQPGASVLRGRTARQQLVVTGRYETGQRHDLTRDVRYELSDPSVAEIADDGFVTPLSDGIAIVTATSQAGLSAELSLTVENIARELPINFSNQIVPIFTKLGCNAGGCHGKSDGQNGFKLSLLGFYPEDDYEYLVKENRGRRIFPAAPEHSLLLLKPSGQVPHGGGQRFEPGSYQWQLIQRWIEQGMPYGSDDDPVVERIEVYPDGRSMNGGARQQLAVVAHFSDGSLRDVTRMATYESNDGEMADAGATGVINTFYTPGDVAVMIRFQGQVTVFRGSVPLGLPVADLPPVRNVVDEHVFAKLRVLGIPPSPLCDDAAFVRRVSIDIAGRLPTADEAKVFIESTDPDKREALIDRLLEEPGYGYYFANKWAGVLRNKRRNNADVAFTYRFHSWIRQAMQQNLPYDQFVRNILAATGDVEVHPPVAWYKEVATATEQMEDTAQLFLGLRIQCARCHHHPFEKWSQNDYYGFQAFFAQVGRKPGREGVQNERVFHRPGEAKARNPRNSNDLVPTGLGDAPQEIPAYEDPRHRLVDWMAGPDNPFFARALVNRYWKHFFGRGIVDPEDDMRVTNPPSNPELLDALAQHFIASGFDLKDLVRTICRSSVYQLSSEPTDANKMDKQNYSSFYPRRLNAEPLYDAVNQVAGTTVNFGGMPAGTRAVELPDNGFNDYFLTVFGKPEAESACECERSDDANLAQSLHLLNSTDIQSKLSAGDGRAAQLAADEERSTDEKVRELYYWAFARPPRPDEMQIVSTYLDENRENQKQAIEDVLWALLNTKEFLFNR